MRADASIVEKICNRRVAARLAQSGDLLPSARSTNVIVVCNRLLAVRLAQSGDLLPSARSIDVIAVCSRHVVDRQAQSDNLVARDFSDGGMLLDGDSCLVD